MKFLAIPKRKSFMINMVWRESRMGVHRVTSGTSSVTSLAWVVRSKIKGSFEFLYNDIVPRRWRGNYENCLLLLRMFLRAKWFQSRTQGRGYATDARAREARMPRLVQHARARRWYKNLSCSVRECIPNKLVLVRIAKVRAWRWTKRIDAKSARDNVSLMSKRMLRFHSKRVSPMNTITPSMEKVMSWYTILFS